MVQLAKVLCRTAPAIAALYCDTEQLSGFLKLAIVVGKLVLPADNIYNVLIREAPRPAGEMHIVFRGYACPVLAAPAPADRADKALSAIVRLEMVSGSFLYVLPCFFSVHSRFPLRGYIPLLILRSFAWRSASLSVSGGGGDFKPPHAVRFSLIVKLTPAVKQARLIAPITAPTASRFRVYAFRYSICHCNSPLFLPVRRKPRRVLLYRFPIDIIA